MLLESVADAKDHLGAESIRDLAMSQRRKDRTLRQVECTPKWIN
jgi:hypothetical protein